MKLLHTVFLGRPSKDFGYVKEAPPAMLFPAVTLASICVVFGVFAFKLPIPLLINPAIGTGVTYIGAWHPVTATILLVLGLTAGLLVYLATSRGPRKVKPFVGGEDGGTMERLSGTDFYNTLKEIGTLKFLYRRQGALDVYEDGSKVTFFFARILQWLHNGILPTYMVWCLAGMLILFFIFMR
jgi:NADH:ubiquinone oxidoreductase subunit 5 (subunit L)/multisubunit Na+/H+ antiporter MnhA subunit